MARRSMKQRMRTKLRRRESNFSNTTVTVVIAIIAVEYIILSRSRDKATRPRSQTRYYIIIFSTKTCDRIRTDHHEARGRK